MQKIEKLLIITQKVDRNDDVLGFFHEWIFEFAKKFKRVTVVCLYRGEYSLPENVRVLSLGKEKRLSRILYLYRFYKYTLKYRSDYDAVFVHMNPVYIVLGGFLWRFLGKRISLWYAHGYVPFMLRISDKITHTAFASTLEGYRLKSKKLKIVGQGIDTSKFIPNPNPSHVGAIRVISVGRISPSKDYATLFQALRKLPKETVMGVDIVGRPATEDDEAYLIELKDIVRTLNLSNVVQFRGAIANKDLVSVLQDADVFANMSHTGSLDKANLEAMSCGLVLLTCNEAFTNVLGGLAKELMYGRGNESGLAEKLIAVNDLGAEKRRELGMKLRTIITENHTLQGLIAGISNHLRN